MHRFMVNIPDIGAVYNNDTLTVSIKAPVEQFQAPCGSRNATLGCRYQISRQFSLGERGPINVYLVH
jgi:hypothetical protein